MRVVSLVPSATELLCTAGGEDLLVGRSHECDWPATIMNRPILTAPRINASAPADIDSEVSTAREDGQSLYELDVELLSSLQPDVIITQDLCGVCSIDLDSVREVARTLPGDPQILSLNPRCMEDVFDDLLRIGKVCAILNPRPARSSLAATSVNAGGTAQDFVNANSLMDLRSLVLRMDRPALSLQVTGRRTSLMAAAGGRHAI